MLFLSALARALPGGVRRCAQNQVGGWGDVPLALTLVSPEEALSFECQIPRRFPEVTVLRAAGWPVCPAAPCGQIETASVTLRGRLSATGVSQACFGSGPWCRGFPGASSDRHSPKMCIDFFQRQDTVCGAFGGRLVQAERMGLWEMILSFQVA